ncbi:SMI1/KNR4 family protein [Priestia megaterium]|uniref:SMI1/KNR4 family protein n=1 Tax=Priestia megaterium TaxID=1404 RepID=UPI001EDA02D7|nr:SMI1/KNR4 family protein [Priestia megaterium]UKJ81071.1 SMI1/KNR4 family protein [Priestia megaterium]
MKKEVSLETILDVEKAWDVLFPIDFMECVTKYHGGEPSADGFNVGKRECSFYQLLSFNQEKKDYILNVYHDLKYQLVDGIYPFGDDIADNHVCFDYRSNSQRPPAESEVLHGNQLRFHTSSSILVVRL